MMPSASQFYNLTRAFFHAFAAAGTLLIIHVRQIAFHGDCAGLAVLHAFHTADAAGLTGLIDVLAFIMGITLYTGYP